MDDGKEFWSKTPEFPTDTIQLKALRIPLDAPLILVLPLRTNAAALKSAGKEQSQWIGRCV